MQELSTARARVCLYEEQTLLREALAQLLLQAGFTITSVHAQARSWLACLGLERVEVALIDPWLAGDGDLTLLQEAHHLHPEVRLLVLSGQQTADGMEACLAAGAAGYLEKGSATAQSVVDAVEALAMGNNVLPVSAVESLLRGASTAPERGPLSELSSRERQVLGHLSIGSDNAKIAVQLGISERTVKAHVSSLYKKLCQKNRTQLALLARQAGLRPVLARCG